MGSRSHPIDTVISLCLSASRDAQVWANNGGGLGATTTVHKRGARAQHGDALVEGAEARKATSVQENAGGRRPASGRGWGRQGGGKSNNGGAAPAVGQGESYTGEPMCRAF